MLWHAGSFVPINTIDTTCNYKTMTDNLEFKAMTPEERARAEAEMNKDADANICLNCGS